MIKRRIILLILIVFVLLIGFLFLKPWAEYYFALKRQHDEWYNEQFLPREISGQVKSLKEAESGGFVSLIIETDEEDIGYGLCPDKESPIRKVKRGSQVKKNPGESTILFIDRNDTLRSELPFCYFNN